MRLRQLGNPFLPVQGGFVDCRRFQYADRSRMRESVATTNRLVRNEAICPAPTGALSRDDSRLAGATFPGRG
jgi:hypothetical protein